MNKQEIKNIVINTSKNYYMRQQFMSENSIEESFREDEEELQACKTLVKEALCIPTYGMNTLYGYNKAIESILKEVNDKLGTENQNDIESYTESINKAYNKANENNKEYYNISTYYDKSRVFKAVRECLEGYHYDSLTEVCNYLISMIESYNNKILDIESKYDNMDDELKTTYRVLKENGISDKVEYYINHMIMNLHQEMNTSILKDNDYILKLLSESIRNTDIEEEVEETTIEDKESIISIFGETFYENRQ